MHTCACFHCQGSNSGSEPVFSRPGCSLLLCCGACRSLPWASRRTTSGSTLTICSTTMLAPKRWGSLLRLGDCLLWPSYIWHGSDHCEDVVLSSSFIKSVYLHRSQQAMTTWALKEESTIRTLARPSWRPAKSKWRTYRNRLVFWIINQAQCIFIFSKYKFSPIQIEWVNWRCRTEKQFPICLTVFRLQAYYFLLIVSTIVDTFYTPESSSAFKLRKQFHVPF